MSRSSANPTWMNVIVRSVISALLWLAWNGHDLRSWIIGMPMVFLATWISLKLPRPLPTRLSAWGVLSFAAYFLHKTMAGAWDVAQRALRPGCRWNPGFLTYQTRLPDGPPLNFFANSISLLPGTLVHAIDGPAVGIHVLDRTADIPAELGRLEARVAAVFNIDLAKPTQAA